MNLETLQANFQEYMMRCNVPRATRDDLARDVRPTAAVRSAETWWVTRELSLLLVGGVGTGKTLAACLVLRSNWRTFPVFMHEPGDMPASYGWRSGIYVDMGDLSARGLFDDDAKLIRHRAQECELAILDEVGRERGDGAQALESIFMARYSSGKRTIIAANVAGEVLTDRLGARVMDRIQGNGRAVNCGTESMR